MTALDPRRLAVFCDFDGTITEPDTLRFLTENVGGGVPLFEEIGRQLRAGKIGIRKGVAWEVGSVRIPFAEAVPLLRAGVTIDPGFAPLAAWCRARTIPLTILSAGLGEIVDAMLSPDTLAGVEVLANALRPGTWEVVFRDESDHGHDKSVAIKVARDAGRRTVFIGDGISDWAPAEVADEVFAKRGRSLVEHCRRRGIACVEYESLADVLEHLEARVVGP